MQARFAQLYVNRLLFDEFEPAVMPLRRAFRYQNEPNSEVCSLRNLVSEPSRLAAQVGTRLAPEIVADRPMHGAPSAEYPLPDSSGHGRIVRLVLAEVT